MPRRSLVAGVCSIVIQAAVVGVLLTFEFSPNTHPESATTPDQPGAWFSIQRAPSPKKPEVPKVVEAPRTVEKPSIQLSIVSPLREDPRSLSVPTLRPPRSLALPRDIVTLGSLRVDRSHRIVMLVDTSEAMKESLNSVVPELLAAIGRLSEDQQFAVIPFQSGKAILAPEGEMRRAGPTFGQSGLNRLRDWIVDSISPTGSSDPREALRAAALLQPDTILIVSAGLHDSASTPALRDALLHDVEAIIPADTKSTSHPIRIACLHIGQADPLGTLAAIAKRHGHGAYRFVAATDDLAIEAPSDGTPADSTAKRVDQALLALENGEIARARIELLRVGLGEPTNSASARALLEAARISLDHDHDAPAALTLASASLRSARAFGMRDTAMRASAIARKAADLIAQPKAQGMP